MAENPRIEELRRRVQADPASIAFAALAEEFRRVGRYDEAVETCRTGLQRHPAYLSARVTLGRALIETGDFDAAREELDTVLRSAPENLAAIRGLAQIHERLGHSAEMDPHLADMMKTMHAESLRVPVPVPVTLELPLQPDPLSANPPPPELEVARESEAEVSLAPQPGPELSLAPQSEPELSLAPQHEPEVSPAPHTLPGLSLAPPMAPAFSLAPDPQAETSVAPEPDPAGRVEAPLDVFAAFAPASKREPSHDLSFDLSTAFSVERIPERPVDTPFAQAVEPLMAPVPEPAIELSVEPAIAPVIAAVERVVEPVIAAVMPPVVAASPGGSPAMPLAPQRHTETSAVFSGGEGPDLEVLATLARLERFLGAIQSLRA